MKVEIEVSDNIVPEGYEIEGIRVLCSRQHSGTPVLLGAGVQYFSPDIDRHGVYIVLREKKVRKYVTLGELRLGDTFTLPGTKLELRVLGRGSITQTTLVREPATDARAVYPNAMLVEVWE